MQQIERYGVIALVFLLVTIVAVSFWGDSKSPGFWSRLTGRGAKKESIAAQTANLAPPANATERAIEGELPMSPATGFPASTGTGALAEPTPTGSANGANGFVASDPTVVPATTGNSRSTGSQPFLARAPAPVPVPALAPSNGPVSTPAAATRGSEYVVQKGDSLLKIASKALGSASRWPEIQALNGGVQPKNLRVGMKLVLPAAANVQKTASQPKAEAPVKKAATAPASKASASSGGTYVVHAGDTLKSIAARLLGDGDRWKEIASANPSLDPKKLSVGKMLHMPEGKASALLAAAQPSAALDRPHVR
jgi:nucleoid-associated protein YgaU